MADYGVPDDEEGLLPWSWAEERLLACRNFWLVTVSGEGRPHAMPLWGVWSPPEQAFWFSCAPGSRKVRNLAANPRVVVAVDDTVECVSVEGRAERLDDDDDRRAAAAAWAAKYAEPGREEEMAAFMAAGAVYEVTPERAFGIIEREEDFAVRATRWRWVP
jgi:PPOX class probable F420-dependent enzyme